MLRPNLSGLGEIFYFASKSLTVKYLHLNDAAWYDVWRHQYAISFYDVIYLTEHQWSVRAFKLLKTEPFFVKNIDTSFMYAIPLELPSPW